MGARFAEVARRIMNVKTSVPGGAGVAEVGLGLHLPTVTSGDGMRQRDCSTWAGE
jgi:hypothetical protein